MGRLGIITELDIIITPQAMVTRTQQQLSWAQFVAWIGATQETYKAALASGSQAAISAALAPLDMAQVCCCCVYWGCKQGLFPISNSRCLSS